MFRRACGKLLWRGSGVLREGRCFFALLFERLCGVRGGRPQLHIGLVDRAACLGRLIRQDFWTRLLLQRLSRLRCGRLHGGLLDLRSLLRSRLRSVIGFGLLLLPK